MLSRSISLVKKGKIIIQSIALFLTTLLLLSGCTIFGSHTSESDDSLEQQHSFDHLPQNWRINGRISIINEQENWYAKFLWVQKKQDFQLSFTGPLGETELQVSQIGQNVRLKTPAKEINGDNLEQLIYQETGWAFPVTSLRYWSQGFPNPEMKSQLKYNDEQHISDIFQEDWHIQYPKRIEVEQLSGQKLWLPKKIIATRQDVKIKLIITRWHLGESSFNLSFL
ncbi:MAG: lipoprotein insertase outer membrane protein LolB [Gammaproteobacteria bacterium]|nr:lipoprotein insertase outer membrane protein LolB [Gammaproteobacteria bacterium]